MIQNGHYARHAFKTEKDVLNLRHKGVEMKQLFRVLSLLPFSRCPPRMKRPKRLNHSVPCKPSRIFFPPPFLSLLSDCSLPRWEMSLEMIRGRAGFLSLSQNPSLDSFELASVQGPAYPATSKTLETACYIRAAVTTDALPT